MFRSLRDLGRATSTDIEECDGELFVRVRPRGHVCGVEIVTFSEYCAEAYYDTGYSTHNW